jgi:hypothetical protein
MWCNLRVVVGDVKESRNDNPTRDLQMATDRTWFNTLCGPVDETYGFVDVVSSDLHSELSAIAAEPIVTFQVARVRCVPALTSAAR